MLSRLPTDSQMLLPGRQGEIPKPAQPYFGSSGKLHARTSPESSFLPEGTFLFTSIPAITAGQVEGISSATASAHAQPSPKSSFLLAGAGLAHLFPIIVAVWKESCSTQSSSKEYSPHFCNHLTAHTDHLKSEDAEKSKTCHTHIMPAAGAPAQEIGLWVLEGTFYTNLLSHKKH